MTNTLGLLEIEETGKTLQKTIDRIKKENLFVEIEGNVR